MSYPNPRLNQAADQLIEFDKLKTRVGFAASSIPENNKGE